MPILLEIISLGSGFYFLDKNDTRYPESLFETLQNSYRGLDFKMAKIIEMENERREREKQDEEILEAAKETLKLLDRNGKGSI